MIYSVVFRKILENSPSYCAKIPPTIIITGGQKFLVKWRRSFLLSVSQGCPIVYFASNISSFRLFLALLGDFCSDWPIFISRKKEWRVCWQLSNLIKVETTKEGPPTVVQTLIIAQICLSIFYQLFLSKWVNFWLLQDGSFGLVFSNRLLVEKFLTSWDFWQTFLSFIDLLREIFLW